jgi:DNA-binding NarL/FixJ family response regulator
MRVILIDDAALVRHGLARLLADEGIEVAAQLADAVDVAAAVERFAPDAVVLDIRMPPTHTTEGLEAALALRDRYPTLGVLLLSQHLESRHAIELLDGRPRGIGYLLKERIADPAEFVAAVRRVAAGGTAIDPEVLHLVLRRSSREDPLAELTSREREILQLIAEGWSNPAIAERLWLTVKTVESHVRSIFLKLGLPPEPSHDRRVRAVLVHLRTADPPRHHPSMTPH